jgi:hypothetical protein
LSSVEQVNQLKSFTGVHGQHWKDLPVYPANDLPVKALVSYDKMFTLLKEDHVDYFHRGLTEVWDEQKKHSDSLIIADKVMLFYKLPVYFFVTKLRPLLAVKLEKGLQIAISDGSYKKLFLKEYGDFIAKAKLEKRKLIILSYPKLPVNTPVIDVSWWAPKRYINKILAH